MNQRHSSESLSFINKFPEKRRTKVSQYLLALGVDMAKKLGQPAGSNELYQTLSQLAKNIENTARLQERNHNQYFQADHEYRYQQDQYRQNQQHNQHYQAYVNKNKSKHPSSTYYSPTRKPNYFENDYQQYQEPRYHHDQYHQSPPFHSDKPNRVRSPKHWGDSRQHHSDQITAKITESPPPAIYIQSMNTHIDVRRHLDDHQIKELLYDHTYDETPQKYYGNSPPRSIKYSIPMSSQQTHQSHGMDEGYMPHPPKQKAPPKPQRKKQQSRENTKMVPQYLKNVQSKIKEQVQQDKLMYQQHREDDESEHQKYRDDEFDNENIGVQQSKQEEETYNPHMKPRNDAYYDIQQYLIDQRNLKQFSFSPVQEMNAVQDPNWRVKQPDSDSKRLQFVSDFQYQQPNFKKKDNSPPLRARNYPSENDSHQKPPSGKSKPTLKVDHDDEDNSSDMFSNFTPPNKEVQEFFQRQFAQNDP